MSIAFVSQRYGYYDPITDLSTVVDDPGGLDQLRQRLAIAGREPLLLLAQDCGKAPPPETVADEHRIRPAEVLLGRAEIAAQRGRDSPKPGGGAGKGGGGPEGPPHRSR